MSPPQGHSSLGASSSHRWIPCPGSVSLIDSLLEVPGDGAASPYAVEGTLAHNYVEEVLTVGDAKKSIEVSDDMQEHTKVYTDFIGKLIKVSDWYALEQSFSLADLNPPVDAYGTADFVGYNADEKSLCIADLKYGQGVVVEVTGNTQLWYYALGGLLEFQKLNPGTIVEKIMLIIIQPRAFHEDGPVRVQIVDVMELFEFADTLLAAMHKTQDPNPEFKAGDHCRFCPAAAVCETLLTHNQEIAQEDFMEPMPTLKKMDNDQVGHLLGQLDSIEHWVASIRMYAQGELSAGREIPGWKLVDKQARRQWTDPEAAKEYLVNAIGVEYETVVTTKLKSPAQIDKIAGLDDEDRIKMADYYDKVSSGTKLAKQSSKLPDAAPVGTEFFDAK